MPKTPEQIYDEVEARWQEARDDKKVKSRRRFAEGSSVVGGFAMFIVWAVTSKLNSVAFALGPMCASYAFAELRKRWTLEDRIEALEKKGEERANRFI